MTSLFWVLAITSLMLGAIHDSPWANRFERRIALNWFIAALFSASSGSLLLIQALAIKQHQQLPTLTAFLLLYSLLEYVLAFFAFAKSICALNHPGPSWDNDLGTAARK